MHAQHAAAGAELGQRRKRGTLDEHVGGLQTTLTPDRLQLHGECTALERA